MTTVRDILSSFALILAVACSDNGATTNTPDSTTTSATSGAAGAAGGGGGSRSASGGAIGGGSSGQGGNGGSTSIGATGGGPGGAAGAGGTGAGAAGGADAGSPDAGSLDAGRRDGSALGSVFLYVSGYGSTSIGIYRFDTATGALTAMGQATAGGAPTYSVADSAGKFLYVDDEAAMASITAYGIGPTGALTKMNTVLTGGQGTAHLAISPDGKWIVAADYDSNSIDVLGINADGRVGAVSDSQPGCPAAHNVQFDSSGKFLLAACKSDTGADTPRILQFAFASGKLMPNNPGVVMFGADPRHMTFDSGRKHLYVITEGANQLFWFDYDSNAGKVSNPQMISALDAGGRTGAGGHIAFGGARLYVSNRSDNSIGIFSVDAAGRPQKVGWQRMGAADVREFSFDPTGQFMVTANQSSSQVTVFRVDPAAGTLTQVGPPTTVASQATAVTFASR